MNRTNIIVPVILLSALALACKDDGTTQPPIPERVKLTLIDVSVKEAFIHVSVSNPASNEMLSLRRRDTTVMTFAAVADTNITDTALTQTTTYQYAASLAANNSISGTSNTISAQTLAPTSHNFTWQTFLLGDGNNSALYDVAIIGDSLIYAVGEMYLRDSTGQFDPEPYGMAIWDSMVWQVKRLYARTQAGNDENIRPITGLFAFSRADVWLSDGNAFHWNGADSRLTPYWISGYPGNPNPILGPNQGVNELWGTSSQNLYGSGVNGGIGYFDGSNWRHVESGTTTNILDTRGVTNPVTGKEEVYCPVTSVLEPGDNEILRITNHTTIDSVRWDTGRNVYSIWTNKGFPTYACGSGVFENKSGHWTELDVGRSGSTNKVRGTALNDIFIVGALGLVAHYNGVDWHVYSELNIAGYTSVALRGNMAVAVGESNGRGFIAVGRIN